ncbi:MAG: hypothetical protein ABII82_07445 [Verrucomicrobiota bacterium]
MAWRIDETVIRGEVDNRVRGRVTGRLWFAGRDEPVTLELEGNAWRDVAGHVLRFTNPDPRAPRPGELDGLAALQNGVVGDITASRKVKVPECTMDELMDYYEAKKPFPWHWGNSLYLEWHSRSNGRVVIESATYQLELDPETTWTMSEAEEEEQRRANGRAMTDFMDRLLAGLEAADASDFVEEFDDETDTDDDDAPTTAAEAKADAEQARMDLLLDRATARMEREALEPEDWKRVFDEERARLRRERGEPEPEPLTPEQEAAQAEWIEEMNAAAEEAMAELEAEKWKKADGDDANDEWHPLVERGHALSDMIHHASKTHGWLSDDDPREHPLRELADGVMIATGKLAGALGSTADGDDENWPPDALFAGGVLVRLKKARGYLRDALAGLDAADEQSLAEPNWRAEVRLKIEAMLVDIEVLINDARIVLEEEAGDGSDDEPY